MSITVQHSMTTIKRERRLAGRRKATANQRQRVESLTTKVAAIFGIHAPAPTTQPPASTGA